MVERLTVWPLKRATQSSPMYWLWYANAERPYSSVRLFVAFAAAVSAPHARSSIASAVSAGVEVVRHDLLKAVENLMAAVLRGERVNHSCQRPRKRRRRKNARKTRKVGRAQAAAAPS